MTIKGSVPDESSHHQRSHVMLTSDDRLLVEQFERRLTMSGPRTGVEAGWHTGFYLWGEGGISKSWTVLDRLDDLVRITG